MRFSSPLRLRITVYLLLGAAIYLAPMREIAAAATRLFTKGELVRLSRGETLSVGGKKVGAPKGQEFVVLQQDARNGLVTVPFVKNDGAPVAITIPADALESVARDGWADLLQGAEAFRDQRYDEARKLLLAATQDPQYRSLAGALAPRLNAAILAATPARAAAGPARDSFAKHLQTLRETGEQLSKLGYPSLALAVDDGTDRLGALVFGASAPQVPATKNDRADLARRVSVVNRSLAQARQAIALHRLVEATKYIDAGLEAESARPELKAFQDRTQKDIAEAEENYKAADRMRQFNKGAVHALTALERGLKACADHPKLLALKKEMQGAFEERTSPPLTTAILARLGPGKKASELEEGRTLYTTRCTECHDLELLDSRSLTGWQKTVAGMAGRANLSSAQQAKVLDYISVASQNLAAE